jgi:hypothetical protein
VLRPGNAGANTAADRVEIVDLALEQLPREVVETTPIVSGPTAPPPPAS